MPRPFALLTLVAVLAMPSGCGETRPVTPIVSGGCGLTAAKIRVTTVDKVDLLFVVDNSLSMGDKQRQLAQEMPALIKALTNPDLDPRTGKPKTKPAADLHVGVITTSLGSHGTSACDPSLTNKHNDDHGHLLPRVGDAVRADCPVMTEATALSWAFDPRRTPGAMYSGAGGSAPMQTLASCIVQSVGEDGCGYEETWESVYHFLVDPAPYLSAEVKCTYDFGGDVCGNNKIQVKGIDTELLAQRSAFLRKDSLLAVVVISDENDASLKPASLNWLPWGYPARKMLPGWTGCPNVPDDFEPETASEYDDLHKTYGCFSCFENASDPNCTVPWSLDKLNGDGDGRNLRAFHQVQRYGYNFLWSRQRYVDAFSKAVAVGSDGVTKVNPIFGGGFRSTDLVVVAGIVGVPNVLVEDASGPKALTDADWRKIVGPIGERDPHMIESIAPRTDKGIKQFAGDRSIDEINGGDRDIFDGDDLQYACIAKRASDSATADCEGSDAATRNPLCQAGGKQPYFKAYPGLRHLRILRQLGASGYVASICNSSYRAAIAGVVDRLQAALSAQCVRTVLTQDEATREVPCQVVESLATDTLDGNTRCENVEGYCTPGAKPCRREGSAFLPVAAEEAAAQLNLAILVTRPDGTVVDERVQSTVLGGNVYATGSDGKKHLLCEMLQLAGGRVPSEETNACLTDPGYGDVRMPSTGGGWCYSKDPAIIGDACTKYGAPGKIRYLGNTQPRSGSEVFTICVTPSGC